MGSALTTAALLNVWEHGLTEKPLQRALNLLAAAHPEASLQQLQQLSIGQRDAQLIEIREALYGEHLTCLVPCPQCGEQLEITLDTRQLRSLPASPAGSHSLTVGDCEVQFRLPDSTDLLLLADLPDAARARHTLLERCVRQAARNGEPLAAADLPEEVVTGIASRMAELDPQADIQIALDCPNCARHWTTNFEISSYLWSEINAWAVRLLREVHRLARAYGWREADILALSPLRRQFYLELIG